MSKIKAKIIADSLSPQGDRLTTFVVTFPRIILSEFNTHRMFSRNSASSRAIPFEKMVKMVEENPFIPIAWQKEHKGMQGSEYFTDELSIQFARSNWLTARDNAVKGAMSLHSTDNGYGSVTKQLCNRLLEPFMWHTVIVTSGKEGLENFFNLRCPQYVIKWRENVAGSYGTDAPMKIISRQEVFKSKGEIANYRIKHNLKSALSQYITVENKKDVYYISEEKSLLRRLQVNTSQAEIHIQALAEAMWDSYNESTPKQLKAGEWHIPGINIIEDL